MERWVALAREEVREGGAGGVVKERGRERELVVRPHPNTHAIGTPMRSSNLSKYLLIGSLLLASAAVASPASVSDETALERLSVEWMAAIENKDRKALESILADNFVLQMPGDTSAQYTRRQEWLENAIGMDWSNFRYENVVARVHGDHATVSSRLFFKVGPNPLTFDSGVIDTWERRGGRWQVTTRYLGESQLKGRMSFTLGVLAGVLALAAAYLVVRLAKWARRRAV
jgi:Domain of unknown function (DUF4440)